MGNKQSKDSASLAKATHFTITEVKELQREFEKVAVNNSISKDNFKQTVSKFTQNWSGANAFLERLFDAFDVDGSKSIDFMEFIDGFSVFVHGEPDEKVKMTFKMYDVNGDGSVTKKEVMQVMLDMYNSHYKDGSGQEEIQYLVGRMFDDLDVNGDGDLSLEEYKLSALKEPLIVDFLDQFLKRPE